MPLYLDRTFSADGSEGLRSPHGKPEKHSASNGVRPVLTIGLVNNMQDGALDATERQFTSLLNAASGDATIRLRLYQLPGIHRGEAATRHIATRYSDIETMWDEKLDGLIVTGREPSTVRLQDEPYWESFVRLLDWAHDHTRSTIWSCLAAHAAVLQLDGIQRVRSSHKNCGLFECELLSDHPIAAGTEPRFRMAHSRWNGLAAEELLEHGYEIVSKSESAGVDAFLRQNSSLFVFFQGHPEYEANTLLLEYRRDLARYLRGESPVYPSIPHGYFDDATTAALHDIAHEARLFPREEFLREASAVLEKAQICNSWQRTAVSMYRNWLHYLAAQRAWPLHRSTDLLTASQLSKAEGYCLLN